MGEPRGEHAIASKVVWAAFVIAVSVAILAACAGLAILVTSPPSP